MPLLSADPRVTRSRRSATAVSSCPAGTTRLTSPPSSAVLASITSPERAISTARFRPTFLAMATMGVWQNQPPFPPGAAKPASSLATARSVLATRRQIGIGDVGEVVPGAEDRAVAGQDDAEGVALPDITQRRDQLAHVRQRQGIAPLRPVHRDGGELTGPLDQDVLEAHGGLLLQIAAYAGARPADLRAERPRRLPDDAPVAATAAGERLGKGGGDEPRPCRVTGRGVVDPIRNEPAACRDGRPVEDPHIGIPGAGLAQRGVPRLHI